MLLTLGSIILLLGIGSLVVWGSYRILVSLINIIHTLRD